MPVFSFQKMAMVYDAYCLSRQKCHSVRDKVYLMYLLSQESCATPPYRRGRWKGLMLINVIKHLVEDEQYFAAQKPLIHSTKWLHWSLHGLHCTSHYCRWQLLKDALYECNCEVPKEPCRWSWEEVLSLFLGPLIIWTYSSKSSYNQSSHNPSHSPRKRPFQHKRPRPPPKQSCSWV